MNQSAGIILPVAYFPPVTYFAHLASAKEAIIETGETYPKQTLRNRCEIGDSHGRLILVIPVSKPHGNYTKTHEVFISDHEDWQKKHWRALETAYSSAPYFLYYSDGIRQLIFASHPTLAEMDIHITRELLKMLKIDQTFTVTKDFLKEAGGLTDLREIFTKKTHGSFALKPYGQVFFHKTGFLPDLSILDLLFNMGPASRDYLQESISLNL